MKMPLLITLSFTTLVTGCSPLREVRFDTIQNSSQVRANAIVKKNSTRLYKNNEPYISEDLTSDVKGFEQATQNHIKKLRELEEMVANIEGVESVNIAIIKNSAIVSINFEQQVNNKDTIKIKNYIRNKIKQANPSIQSVSITAAPEFVERVNKISMNLEENKIDLTKEQQEIITSLRPII